MDYLQAILFGIVQGLFEWLPVSSEAFIVILSKYMLGMDIKQGIELAIWLHLGTLISATIYFRKEIIEIINEIIGNFKTLLEKKEGNCKIIKISKLTYFLFISTLFSGIIAFPILLFAINLEINDTYFLIFIGLFLLFISIMQRVKEIKKKKKINHLDSIIVGIMQGFAVLPGISRSGITTGTLLLQGYSVEKTFQLSFLMSIPIVFLAQFAFPIIKGTFLITGPMIVSALIAAIVGYFSIHYLIEFAKKYNFKNVTLGLGLFVIILGIITNLL
jgi:undecaprenyl-diphosphatase